MMRASIPHLVAYTILNVTLVQYMFHETTYGVACFVSNHICGMPSCLPGAFVCVKLNNRNKLKQLLALILHQISADKDVRT